MAFVGMELTLTRNQARAIGTLASRRCLVRGASVVVAFLSGASGAGLYAWVAGRRETLTAPAPLFAPQGDDRVRTFSADRLPARDAEGWTRHPDLAGIGENEEPIEPTLNALGFRCAFVSMESTGTRAATARYFDAGEPNCSDWTPPAPDREGWLLAAIYDTEDGPYALFVRPFEN